MSAVHPFSSKSGICNVLALKFNIIPTQ